MTEMTIIPPRMLVRHAHMDIYGNVHACKIRVDLVATRGLWTPIEILYPEIAPALTVAVNQSDRPRIPFYVWRDAWQQRFAGIDPLSTELLAFPWRHLARETVQVIAPGAGLDLFDCWRATRGRLDNIWRIGRLEAGHPDNQSVWEPLKIWWHEREPLMSPMAVRQLGAELAKAQAMQSQAMAMHEQARASHRAANAQEKTCAVTEASSLRVAHATRNVARALLSKQLD